ncbi:MAG: patatin-like phospholipase family protein [Chromatiales bacterium]|nr:patatin-like phospholipase family protein [Chromatiales bacterium]
MASRISKLWWLTVCLLLWAGSATAEQDQQAPMAEAQRPRICLALGGGGARGMAHVGILRLLDEMRVPVDCVAGTSIGSIVGGLYALGFSLEEMEEVVLTTDWEAMFSDRPPRREMTHRRRQDDLSQMIELDIGVDSSGLKIPRGLIQGQNMLVFLRRLSKDYALVKNFDDLPVPFRAVATDIETGESVAISSGDLSAAVRASIGIPALLTPAEIDGRWLVDGGLFANVPVDAAHSMGAQVVIAVDVGFPTRTREELASAIEIADQTVTLMMRKGTVEQLKKLGEADVIIVPELGNTSSAAFDSATELMEIGYQAGRAMADSLARYSLGPDEYAAHLKARGNRIRVASVPVVKDIEVDVDGRISDKAILAWMSQEPGNALDLDVLERDVQRIYGQGVFESVDYSLIPEGDQATLEISAIQKSWGPNFLKFGVMLQENFEGDSDLSVSTRYTMTQVNPLAAEWRSELEMGSDSGLFTEFYQPLNYGSAYFLAVSAEGNQRILTVYDDAVEHPIGEVRYRNLEFRFDVGKEAFSLGEFRLGVLRGKAQRRLRVGDPNELRLADSDIDQAEVSFRFEHDSLDRVPFALDGSIVYFEAATSRVGMGATTDFDRYQFRGTSAWSTGGFTALFGLELSSYRNVSQMDSIEPFSLGGFLRLSGLNRNELTGQHLMLGKVILMQRMDAMKFGSIPVYLGGSAELGNAWQELDNVGIDSALWSGSVFIAADTFLGPVYLGTGRTEGERGSLFLAIGHQY